METVTELISSASTECPICDSWNVRSTPAIIAPFIRIRCNIPDEVQGTSNLCIDCDHVFLTPLISEDQLSTYYADYYQPSYFAARSEIEPWFNETLDEYADKGSSYYLARLKFFDQFLTIRADMKNCRVIDFGGGDGWVSRQAFPGAKVDVVDVGYEGDLPELLSKADMLFSAQTFEHFPRPKQQLLALSKHLRSGALVYIEVPIEYLHGRIADAFMVAKNAYDQFKAISEGGITFLHEHVAHYSKRSLARLMTECKITPREVYIAQDPRFLAILGTKN